MNEGNPSHATVTVFAVQIDNMANGFHGTFVQPNIYNFQVSLLYCLRFEPRIPLKNFNPLKHLGKLFDNDSDLFASFQL